MTEREDGKMSEGKNGVAKFGEWISVQERLPESNGAYLCTVNYGKKWKPFRRVLEFSRTIWSQQFLDESSSHCEDVTHWMPLPEAPKPTPDQPTTKP